MYLYSQAIYQHDSVMPTTIMRKDKTIDQQILLLECNAHIAIFRARLQNSRLSHTLYVGSVTNTELSMSHMEKYSYDINSSVLKREAKYSNVRLTRWTQSNSSVFGLWCCLPWWWWLAPPKNVGIWRACISMYILLIQLADNNLIDARYKEHCVNNTFIFTRS
jgi:hypothetical protein